MRSPQTGGDVMTNEQVLAEWDAGHPIKTVEMGGMSEDYEMAIQLCGFEWLRALIAASPNLGSMSDSERKALRDRLVPSVDAACRSLGLVDYYGMSGAQVGAALNLASCFYSQGYEPALESAGEDRHMTISKRRFSPPSSTSPGGVT